MAHNKYFQFKQFRIEQHLSAMKVNTDGVLVGAWTKLNNVSSVLDVGTGTGLIALMIAQRCNAFVTAIDIDYHSVAEAAENAGKSPWADRVFVMHSSFQQFAETYEGQFDLVVSNPPFFSDSEKNTDSRLSVARHNHTLPFGELISGTIKLLAPEGQLSIILPVNETEKFIEIADKNGLFLNRCALVKPFPGKAPNRKLMEFGFLQRESENESFSVYDESGKDYSSEFANLAKGFYLKL